MKKNLFHPGLTIKGTACAGCCSAGIMAFPAETRSFTGLAGKEKEDRGSREPLTKHNAAVKISFSPIQKGGIKAVESVSGNVCSTLSLFCGYWLLLTENSKEKTFGKVWGAFGLDNTGALNSIPVTNVAEKNAAETVAADRTKILESRVSKLPSYVLKDLRILISHPSPGILSREVNFSTGLENERFDNLLYRYSGASHFRLTTCGKLSFSQYLHFKGTGLTEVIIKTGGLLSAPGNAQC